MLMIFLKKKLTECVRHMWDVCDLDVHATDYYGCGVMHYAIHCDLEFLKFMVNTMKVPYNITGKDGRNILWGWKNSKQNNTEEEVLDWCIDELGINPKAKIKEKSHSWNILLAYVQQYIAMDLHRVKYWIETR